MHACRLQLRASPRSRSRVETCAFRNKFRFFLVLLSQIDGSAVSGVHRFR